MKKILIVDVPDNAEITDFALEICQYGATPYHETIDEYRIFTPPTESEINTEAVRNLYLDDEDEDCRLEDQMIEIGFKHGAKWYESLLK